MQESELSYLKSIGAPELFDKLVSQLLDAKPGEPRTFLLEKLMAMRENASRISEFVDRAKSLPQGKGYDLADTSADTEIEKYADQIYEALPTLAELRAAEYTLYEIQDQMPNLLLLALKCAISKRIIADLPQAAHVTVVIPLLKDSVLLQSKAENSKGQDAVRRKERQLEWLCQAKEDFSWNIVYVDDRCPLGSGKVAEDKISVNKLSNSAVYYLEDYLSGTSGKPTPTVLQGVGSASQCEKGAAAHLGFHLACEQRPTSGKCTVAVLNDASLSGDLRQIGILVGPIVADDTRVVVGTRYDPGGAKCSIKQPEPHLSANTHHAAEMTLCHFLRKQMLSNAVVGQGFDFHCPLKAFNVDVFTDVFSAPVSQRGAGFDVELVVLAAAQGKQAATMTPIVWVSNGEDSGWSTSGEVFQAQVQPLIQIHNNHSSRVAKVSGISTEIVEFVKTLTDGTFHKLIQAVRADLTQHYDLFNPHWTMDQLKRFCQ